MYKYLILSFFVILSAQAENFKANCSYSITSTSEGEVYPNQDITSKSFIATIGDVTFKYDLKYFDKDADNQMKIDKSYYELNLKLENSGTLLAESTTSVVKLKHLPKNLSIATMFNYKTYSASCSFSK